MNKIEIDPQHADRVREKIKSEDDYLFNRTNLFLAASSILIASVQFSASDKFDQLIALLGFIVSFVWFICSTQSARVINRLAESMDAHWLDYEKIVYESTYRCPFLKNTFLTAVFLPFVFIVLWAVVILNV